MACFRRALVALLLAFAAAPASAAASPGTDDPADQWLPRSDGAEWTYEWSNSDYAATPRRETYSVISRSGAAFRLRWQQEDVPAGETASAGTIDFQHTDAGLVNLNYQSSQPPPQYPILCASPTDCGNSLASALFLLTWGSRSSTLAEPLVAGTRWQSLGGANNDVGAANRYAGRVTVSVPAFTAPVKAAVVVSQVTQAGAIGDPFGSGVRTVHWVRGVGPVKIVFRHSGGEVSEARLVKTTLKPRPLPSDANLLPLNRGISAKYRWRNSRHMPQWSRQQLDVVDVVNNTARVDVKHLSGPIRVAGSYTFATRLSGVTHLSALTRATSRARFPRLGPSGVPAADRRHLLTPYDLMVFGFGPVTPAYATPGATWRSSRESSDWAHFGVSGRSKVLGTQSVRTPAGTFKAVAIESTLTQRGFRYGSGRRTTWFAPGKGMVKLRFRHADGSVSTVERLR